MIETAQPSNRKPWPDYGAFWRWHFYAGLFCIPFIIVLASSGSIYLFKPQVESSIDRQYDNLAIKDRPASMPTRWHHPRGHSRFDTEHLRGAGGCR